jgi:hypothetical protein
MQPSSSSIEVERDRAERVISGSPTKDGTAANCLTEILSCFVISDMIARYTSASHLSFRTGPISGGVQIGVLKMMKHMMKHMLDDTTGRLIRSRSLFFSYKLSSLECGLDLDQWHACHLLYVSLAYYCTR